MTWMFRDKVDIALPMQAAPLLKNLKFIKFEFNGQGHLGRSLIALICLALLILCQAQAADTGVPSQADDQRNEWDRPFSQPYYLLHGDGYEDTSDPSLNFVKKNLWFLSDREPTAWGHITIREGENTKTWFINKTLGPYNTRREVCTGANGMTGGQDLPWATTSSDGITRFVLANPMSCKDLSSTGETGSTDPVVPSIAAIETVLTIVREQDETRVKPGDKLTLSQEDKINLIAKCKEFVSLVKGSMGNDRSFKDAILALAYFRANGDMEINEETLHSWAIGLPSFQSAVAELITGSAYCAKLSEETQTPLAKSASVSSLPLESSINPSDSAAQIELGLESGPFLAEVVNDEVYLSVETGTATVSSSGKNTFGVAYDPSNGTTYVAAYDRPVRVQPTNSNLAPFTLDAGQIVDVSSKGAGAAMPIYRPGTNGTTPGPVATGAPGAGNATAGNATSGTASGGQITPGVSGPGASPGGVASPSGNNQIGDSAEVSAGQSISQTISPAGSSNFYSFRADSSGIVKLKLESVPKDMRPYLALFDKNMASISEKSASNPGDTLTMEKDVQGSGLLYIEVKDAQGKAYNEPYNLLVAFEPAPDQYEPNPNFYRAADVKSGEDINAYICPSGDEDFYKIFVDTSGIFKLKLENVPEDMRAGLQMYDKGFGNEIAYGQASNPGDKLSLEKDVQGPGWFYIKVRDADGRAYSEPYTLKIAFEPAPDQYEPNPNFFRASEITQGQSITAYICPSGDEDFYKFYMGSSGIVKLNLDSVPEDMKAGLQMYDKSFGNEIAYGQASNPGDKLSLEKDVQGPGWFYIKVRDADGKAHSQPYTITASF